MKLIRASIHELTTRDELKVEYARLTYRTRTGIVGQSRLRALTLIDNYTRECLAIDIGQNLRGGDVVTTLTRVCEQRGKPRVIKADNGSEFISKAMDKWANENEVEIDFSRPGKPTDNAQCESFNGRFRQECLNSHWFLSFADAKEKIDAWRTYYNEVRPHSALKWQAPAEYARQHLAEGQNTNLEPEISTSDPD
ncbi:Mobile element protein [plant metagenome]|uniref:Mobile element protein n=1 Tax=plant metagenome TaxID=1297885 RepID=A0A484RXP0_9ZZZZ